MELRVLQYFLVTAREENITRASEVLHITQPTLSRQLAQLEEELGVSLLIRGKRKLSLTEEGMLLRRRAEEILDLVGITEKELSEQNDLVDGEIVIGSGELTSTKTLLPAIISDFHEAYPKVTYDLYTGNADQIKERIDKGLIDIGILLEPVDIEKYDFIRLQIKERWVVLMRADDPLAEKQALTPQDLMDRPLMMVNRSSVKNEISSWFGERYSELNIISTHNMVSNAANLVEKGLGYAFTLEASVEPYAKERFCYRPLKPDLYATTVLVWKKNQTFSWTVRKFLNHTKHYIEDVKKDN